MCRDCLPPGGGQGGGGGEGAAGAGPPGRQCVEITEEAAEATIDGRGVEGGAGGSQAEICEGSR